MDTKKNKKKCLELLVQIFTTLLYSSRLCGETWC